MSTKQPKTTNTTETYSNNSTTPANESTEQQNTSNSNHSTKWNRAHKKIEPIEKPDQTSAPNKTDEFFEKLSNKFVEQQDQIIKFRSTITIWFAVITALQLLVINVLIFFAIFKSQEIMPMLLDFLKYFVGATFVELLGGLFIIVKFVFSHETSDMLKHLTYVGPKTEEKSKT